MPTDPNSETEDAAKPSFWAELKRRKVMRVAITYGVVAWLLIQIAATVFPKLGIPDWAAKLVTVLLLIGFPIALIITWAFELTPDGIRTTKNARNSLGDAPVSKKQLRKRNWSIVLFAAGLPTLIFGSLAVFFYLRSDSSDTETASLENSIAVLPLINMSALDENAYFAGGVHEDVLTNLSRIREMEVVSRTTMLRYAASELTLKEIGEALKVKYIVEGSVRRMGNHVRVTVQLIDAQNDRHLWASNFERELVDVFATQSELAREISNSIHLEIQPETVGNLANMPTFSVRAYDLYLRSISIEKTKGETVETMIQRRGMLEEAVQEDPDFVEAWAHLKRLYDLMAKRAIDRDWYIEDGDDKAAKVADFHEKSKRALAKAVALNPDHFETVLASVVDHVWPQPEEIMRERKGVLDRLIRENPENASVWYHMGWWHNHVEPRGEKAMAAFEQALKLDPFNARYVWAILDQYRQKGDEANVDRLVERLEQIIPETAEDRWLARLGLFVRLRQLTEAFLTSPDEALIAEYERIWKESENERISLIHYKRTESDLRLFTNEKERVLALAAEQELEDSLSWNKFASYLTMQTNALSLLAAEGTSQEIERVAELIVRAFQQAEYLERNMTYWGSYPPLVMSHVLLGESEKAREYLDTLLDNRKGWHGGDVNLWTINVVQAMQWLDPKAAVEFAFSEASGHDNEYLLSQIAAYHLNFPRIINDPKIQAYFLKNGKWMDYLAKRLPEYAKLQTTGQ